MAIIVRIDVDRPYGRRPLFRHVLSRFSSDFYLPRIESLGYLTELKKMLEILRAAGAPSYAFFRQCTLPSPSVMEAMTAGGHELGLHLEDSRSFETYSAERDFLEKFTGRKITSFSKHGSGGAKFGRRHHAPYEPERYLDWAGRTGMKVFFGNLEDPTLSAHQANPRLAFYPSAFWLEPHWRDTGRFTVDWLIAHAQKNDVVMLVHPENVLADAALTADFTRIVNQAPSRILA